MSFSADESEIREAFARGDIDWIVSAFEHEQECRKLIVEKLDAYLASKRTPVGPVASVRSGPPPQPPSRE